MYVGDNFGFVDDDVVVVPVGTCPTVVLTVKSEAARPYMRLYGGVHHVLDWHVL